MTSTSTWSLNMRIPQSQICYSLLAKLNVVKSIDFGHMCTSGRVDMDTCVPPAARGLNSMYLIQYRTSLLVICQLYHYFFTRPFGGGKHGRIYKETMKPSSMGRYLKTLPLKGIRYSSKGR